MVCLLRDGTTSTWMIAGGVRQICNTQVACAATRHTRGIHNDFPRASPSIPALASWLHERGFLFGFYTASGVKTCANSKRQGYVPDIVGHFTEDAQTFAEWGVVCYVKLDWCTLFITERIRRTRRRQTRRGVAEESHRPNGGGNA